MSILRVFRSTSLQSSAIGDFQVAAMFSLYRTMSGTRSHCLSVSLSIRFVPLLSPAIRLVVPPFAKAVIFQRVCVPRSTSPQSATTLISLLRVSRVRDSTVSIMGLQTQ